MVTSPLVVSHPCCCWLCCFCCCQGFVVAAVEHADGTACCTELANGDYMLLKGLGQGAALEAKCDYRVQECVTLAQVLQALNAGMWGCVHLVCLFTVLGLAASRRA
eukprot:GHUV01022549.1.p1 GENE.GHUV01022549.1~~GHUV01022549.1.p1  ORF type:complete len:106 (+),score=20.47 GHUV01022549.1:827-1144(+)